MSNFDFLDDCNNEYAIDLKELAEKIEHLYVIGEYNCMGNICRQILEFIIYSMCDYKQINPVANSQSDRYPNLDATANELKRTWFSTNQFKNFWDKFKELKEIGNKSSHYYEEVYNIEQNISPQNILKNIYYIIVWYYEKLYPAQDLAQENIPKIPKQVNFVKENIELKEQVKELTEDNSSKEKARQEWEDDYYEVQRNYDNLFREKIAAGTNSSIDINEFNRLIAKNNELKKEKDEYLKENIELIRQNERLENNTTYNRREIQELKNEKDALQENLQKINSKLNSYKEENRELNRQLNEFKNPPKSNTKNITKNENVIYINQNKSDSKSINSKEISFEQTVKDVINTIKLFKKDGVKYKTVNTIHQFLYGIPSRQSYWCDLASKEGWGIYKDKVTCSIQDVLNYLESEGRIRVLYNDNDIILIDKNNKPITKEEEEVLLAELVEKEIEYDIRQLAQWIVEGKSLQFIRTELKLYT